MARPLRIEFPGAVYHVTSRGTGMSRLIARSMVYKQGSTTLGDLTYTYDEAGQRVAVGGTYARTNLPAAVASATYDANNRLTAWGGTSYTYDDNGSLLNDGTRTYTWDVRNRLASLSGGATASFQYDATGRRQSKTVSGTTTKFLYDGLNVIQELDGSLTPVDSTSNRTT
jgi:YD repeat-containing protein